MPVSRDPWATVRNPLAGFAITIFGAIALAFLAGIPILFLPQAELVYFYLPFALFGVGMLSGRSGFLGTLGFVGGTLGGFVGIYVFQTLFVPQGWPIWPAGLALLLDFAFGTFCRAGGLVMGRVGLRRADPTAGPGMEKPGWLEC